MGYLIGATVLCMAAAGLFGKTWWKERMLRLHRERQHLLLHDDIVFLRNELKQLSEKSYLRALMKVEDNADAIAADWDPKDDTRSMKQATHANEAFARGTASLGAFTDSQVAALADHGWLRIMNARRTAEQKNAARQKGPRLQEVANS